MISGGSIFLLQETELITLVPARAEGFLRRTGAIRLLEPPVELPELVETLWWHPRANADPGHTWLRTRIHELSTVLRDIPGSVTAPARATPPHRCRRAGTAQAYYRAVCERERAPSTRAPVRRGKRPQESAGGRGRVEHA